MTDYQILRERISSLIVEAAELLDIIGVGQWPIYRPELDDLEANVESIHDAHRDLTEEWDRLVYANIDKEKL